MTTQESALMSAPPFPVPANPIVEALVKKVVKHPVIFQKHMLQPSDPSLKMTFNCDACSRQDLQIMVKCHQAPDIDVCIQCYNARVEAQLSKTVSDRKMVAAAKERWEEIRKQTLPIIANSRPGITFIYQVHDFAGSLFGPRRDLEHNVMPARVYESTSTRDAGNSEEETPPETKKRKQTKK